MRIGMMGFGQVGRQLYRLALEDTRFDIVAISDIGRPEILHHLLARSLERGGGSVRLRGNHLLGQLDGRACRTRLMSAHRPAEVPWDVFDVDLVIDSTGRFRSRAELLPHLENGAGRVLISTLPATTAPATAPTASPSDIDRVVLFGINEASAAAADRIVSAGSASTTAAALALKVVMGTYALAHASITSVHAYTSDQSLQDYAGPDYRRSRSGAENIIPNDTPAPRWVEQALPAAKGKVSGFALNVPVQAGSLLDLTLAFAGDGPDAQAVNDLFRAAAAAAPALIEATEDPIVSSDVKGCRQSLLVDLKGTLKAGRRLVKLLAWHESLGHARRTLDLAALYADLDARPQRAGVTP